MTMIESPETLPAEVSNAPCFGVTLKAFVVDAFGTEHVSIYQTTIPEAVFLNKGAVVRKAIDDYYTALGMQLLSLQREVEQVQLIEEVQTPVERARHLRLVALNGKRVLSTDARMLLSSAGLAEAEARRQAYGEEP